MKGPGLERFHQPMTDVFPRLTEPAAAEPFQLTPSQVADFAEHGWVAGIRVLEPGQVAGFRERLDGLRDRVRELQDDLYEVEASWQARPEEVVFHCLGAWRVDPWFHDLPFHPAVTVPMAQLLGVERLRFWHDQVFYKPPRHPGVVPWHQDYSYWTRTAPPRHLTVNIVLDDVDEANGCLHFVPGSHRWPLQPMVPFDADMDQLRNALPDELQRAFRPVAVPLRAGEASIHHSHLIHGSHANASDGPRRAIVVNAMGPEVRVADGSQPLLSGVPLIPEGEVVSGEHFPIVLGSPDEESVPL